MLEIRQICENCGKSLPNEGTEAMICTFECTFCRDCVENILFNVCPNCSGGLEKRPSRPKELLTKYPPKAEELLKPIDAEIFAKIFAKYKDIPPNER